MFNSQSTLTTQSMLDSRAMRRGRLVVNPRSLLYNAAALLAILVSAPGCGGEPKAPPPGAPDDAAPPAVDLGPQSGAPKEQEGGPTNQSPISGTPEGN